MRVKLGILALLAALTLAHGADTNSVVDDAAIVWATNEWWDLSQTATNSSMGYTSAVLYEGDWVRTTRVTFGDGITLDTETGEVELPAALQTNMTEVARQFWRAVCKVSGAEPPEWLKKEETK